MRKSQIRPMQIPEEHKIPDETLLDIYYDATYGYDFGEVRSEDAKQDKQEVLSVLDTLIDSVRQEGFEKGYRLGYSHGKDGLPDEDEEDELDADEEGWV